MSLSFENVLKQIINLKSYLDVLCVFFFMYGITRQDVYSKSLCCHSKTETL